MTIELENAAIKRIHRTCFGAVMALFFLGGCAVLSNHQFTAPARDWQARNGQLLYRNAKTTLIGEVLVRFSKNGDFELTFSKGPGVTLLTLRQDATSAEIRGALARNGWAGEVAHAPPKLRGGLALRDQLQKAQDQQMVRYTSGTQTFVFRF